MRRALLAWRFGISEVQSMGEWGGGVAHRRSWGAAAMGKVRRKPWLQVMSGLPSFVRQVMVCQCLTCCSNGSIPGNGILGALACAQWDWCVHCPHQMQPDVVQLG